MKDKNGNQLYNQDKVLWLFPDGSERLNHEGEPAEYTILQFLPEGQVLVLGPCGTEEASPEDLAQVDSFINRILELESCLEFQEIFAAAEERLALQKPKSRGKKQPVQDDI